MLRLSFFAALAALTLSACSSNPDLVVYLKTDLVAGIEFTSVDVSVFQDNGREEGATPIGTRTFAATREMRFVPERRVASFEFAENQNVIVLVVLRDANGLIVAQRPTRMTFSTSFGLRVLVTRNCARVTCPTPGGSAINAACLDGRCVDDRCQPDALEFCPAVACAADGTPPSACVETAACANATCDDGVCLYSEPEVSSCPATQWCDPFRGCVDSPFGPESDGGPGDGGAFDMDGAALTDGSLEMSVDGDFSDLMSIDSGDADSGSECAAPDMMCGSACVDLATSLEHCGSCDNDCALLPHVDGASVACVDGSCAITTACLSPYADCNDIVGDGCEADQSQTSSCGDCTTECTGTTAVCTQDDTGHYGCASGCSASTPTLCGSTCVNVDSNPAACGSCSNACASPDHGHATCSARACGIACDPDYHACGALCLSNYDPASCGGRCAACPTVSHGQASCDGTNCGFVCDSGYHACGAVCVDNTSIATCGSSCTTCPGAPPFGMATCDGFVCGFECLAGYHKCGGACVPDDSVSACGTACITCSAPPANGSAACVDGACSSTCDAGYHACGGSCVSDTDPTHCGEACMLCPAPMGGSAVCSGGVCGTTCAAGQHLCGGACVSNTATATCGSSCSPCTAPANGYATCSGFACSFGCNAGYHACGSSCVSNTATATCGSSCTPCSTPANATGLCDGTSCSYTCNSGYHACGGSCVDNTSILSCGASCTTCPGAPAFAMATCDGTSCGWACVAGYHRCGSSCVRDDSTSQCGAACLACSAPPSNGSAACIAGSCSASCNAGYNACSGACVSATDVAHCGSSCTVCPVPSNGVATCDGTNCGFTCSAGYHACGSTCASNTSVLTCGATCGEAPCTAPANATATCGGSACGFTCNAGYTLNGSSCDITAPRPVRPSSTSVMTSQSPQLRWQLGAGTTGAALEICATRTCSSALVSTNVTGSDYTPPSPLAAGVYFWRLRGRIGASVGTTYSPVWQFTVGALSAGIDTTAGTTLRDIDGDGYADVGIGSNTGSQYTVFRGRAGGLVATPDYTITQSGTSGNTFGMGSAITDVNRDGYADILIGDNAFGSNVGRVFVYFGSASGPPSVPSQTIDAPAGAALNFGFAFTPAGDANGDGYADVIIATRSLPYLYLGSATGLAMTPAYTFPIANGVGGLSYRLLPVPGDFNGDGYTDYFYYNDQFWGGSTGVTQGFVAPLSITYQANCSWAAADYDLDGYTDIAISYAWQNLFLYRGGARGIVNPWVQWISTPDAMAADFGASMVSPGDLNGDGFPDLVLSDRYYMASSGRAFVYLGSAVGFATVPNETVYGTYGTNGFFAYAIGFTGDVDADGRSDVMFGSYVNRTYFFPGIAGGAGIGTTASPTIFKPMSFGGTYWGAQLASAENDA